LQGGYCGDGITQSPQEQCDDGNTQSGDGCSATCQTEAPTCINPIEINNPNFNDGNVICNSGVCVVQSNLTFCTVGIRAATNNLVIDCKGKKLTGSAVSYAGGVAMSYRSNITVKNCSIDNFYNGIDDENGVNDRILNNVITNAYTGIYMISTGSTNIMSNSISSTGEGMKLENTCSNNIIDSNTVTTFVSVWLMAGSNNIVKRNNVQTIRIGSSGNSIYYNNIQSPSSTQDNAGGNAWNDSCAGNYWQGLSCTDGNNDGFCDSAITVPGTAGAQDRYPLKSMWPNGYDTDNSGKADCGECITPIEISSLNFNDGNVSCISGACTVLKDLYFCKSGIKARVNNIVIDCKGKKLTGPSATGYDYGVTTSSQYYKRTNVTVENCSITKFGAGILDEFSINNQMLTNIITNANRGISLLVTNNSKIISNSMSRISAEGIRLQDSGYNLVDSNIANVNVPSYAVSVVNSTSSSSSSGNTIKRNNLSKIIVAGTSNNVFYNNIASHGDSWDNGANNRWDDNSCAGNYWNGTLGILCNDTDIDGICDSPIAVRGTAHAQDRYALAASWPAGDYNNNGIADCNECTGPITINSPNFNDGNVSCVSGACTLLRDIKFCTAGIRIKADNINLNCNTVGECSQFGGYSNQALCASHQGCTSGHNECSQYGEDDCSSHQGCIFGYDDDDNPYCSGWEWYCDGTYVISNHRLTGPGPSPLDSQTYYEGILVASSAWQGTISNVAVSNCIVNKFDIGINPDLGNNININSNTITNTNTGISLTGTSNSNVIGNSLRNIAAEGIKLGKDGNSNTIGSNNNVIDSNAANVNVPSYAVSVLAGCSGNTIKRNNLSKIIVAGTSNNIFYNNIASHGDSWDNSGVGGNNAWNDGCAGNNWIFANDPYNTYTCTDANSDGICDSPISINSINGAGAQDNYPLASQWPNGYDSNANGKADCSECLGPIEIRSDGTSSDPSKVSCSGSTCTVLKDINFCNNGIKISKDSITLNCNSKKLTGPSAAGWNISISMSYRSNVIVKNCSIDNFGIGIQDWAGTSNQMLNNIITNAGRGIDEGNSNTISIISNSFSAISGEGIVLADTANSLVDSNNVPGPAYWSIWLTGSGSNNIVKRNNVNRINVGIPGNMIYYNNILQSGSINPGASTWDDNVCAGNNWNGLPIPSGITDRWPLALQWPDAYDKNNNGIADCGECNIPINITKAGSDIVSSDPQVLCSGSTCTVQNDINFCGAGINIEASNIVLNCSNHKLTGSAVSSKRGVQVYKYGTTFSNVEIKNCVIDNFYESIYIDKGSSHNVHDNTITKAYRGIYLINVTSSSVKNNDISQITSGGGSAIYAVTGSSNNIIEDNRHSGASGYGVSIKGAASVNNIVRRNDLYSLGIVDGTSGNQIYYNNIYKKGDCIDSGSNNQWDDGSCAGNHWQDWTGCVDSDGNGICDSPADIKGVPWPTIAAYDNHPLALQWPDSYDDGSTGGIANNGIADCADCFDPITINSPAYDDGNVKCVSGTCTVQKDLRFCKSGITAAWSNIIIDCDGNTLTGSSPTGWYVGVTTSSQYNQRNSVQVTNCIINNFGAGYSDTYGSANQLVGSIITNSALGAQIGNTDHPRIIGNSFSGISGNAIQLSAASDGLINSNNVTGGTYSLSMIGSSNSNLVKMNNFKSIVINEGSTGNSIYYNNILEPSDTWDYVGGNIWDDNVCAGNYWTGITSSTHAISTSGMDNYVLQNPWPADDANNNGMADCKECTPQINVTGSASTDPTKVYCFAGTCTVLKDIKFCASGIDIQASNVVLNCDNNKLYGNYVDDWVANSGVSIFFQSNVRVENCIISGFDSKLGANGGVMIYGFGGHTITSNQFNNIRKGVRVVNSNNNIITGNTITKDTGSGGEGIVLENSNNNEISENSIHWNSYSNYFKSIWLPGSSSNNIITRNSMDVMDLNYLASGTGNEVYYNTILAPHESGFISGVILDDGSCAGNNWIFANDPYNTYTCTDANSDGICENYYRHSNWPSGVQDNHPLVNAWPNGYDSNSNNMADCKECKGTDADDDYYSTSALDEGKMCCVGRTQICNAGIDCRDDDDTTHPGADDSVCDGTDHNCNGIVNDGFVGAPVTTDDYVDTTWKNVDQSITLTPYPACEYVPITETKYCVGSCGAAPILAEAATYALNYKGNRDYVTSPNMCLAVASGKTLKWTSGPYSGQSFAIVGSLSSGNSCYASLYSFDVTAWHTPDPVVNGWTFEVYDPSQTGGCTPDTVGTVISITTDGNYCVNYKSTDSNGNTETPNQINVKLDKTAPTAPSLNALPQWSRTGNVALSWIASNADISGLDRYEVWRQAGVQSFAKVSEDLQVLTFDDTGLATDTTYTYKIKVFDNAGNFAESNMQSITVDTVNPSVQVTAPLNDEIFNVNSVTVNAHYSNTYLVNCVASVDSGAAVDMAGDNQVSGTAAHTFTGLGDGLHDFNVTCTDQAGNSASDYANNVRVDTIAPTASLTVSPTGCTNSAATYNPSCSDTGSGIASCVTYADYNNEGWVQISTEQGEQVYVMQNDGTYKFKTVAVDNAAWTATSSESTTIKDSQTPSTNAALAGTIGGDDWYNSDVTVTVTATNGICAVTTYYCRYTEPATDCTPSLISTPYNDVLGEGINHIKYYSKDTAGNQEAENSKTIKIDKTAPVTTDDYNYNNQWMSFSSVDVALTASDNLAGVNHTDYSINNVPGVYSAPLAFNADGAYTLNYYSTDNANNQEIQKTKTILLDATKPAINITVTPKSWAECAANGWFFWLIWFVDSGTVEYPLVHGCNEVNAVIDASISGLQSYTIKLLDESDNVVATSVNSGLEFNFETSANSYKAVVEATDNANNYATTSLMLYEDDDQDYVPDMLDLCPTIRPAEGTDVNPRDGCPDEPGVPSQAWDRCINIYTGKAITSMYPVASAMNTFTDTIIKGDKKWYGFNSVISNINAVSYVNMKVEDNTVTQCSLDLKSADALTEKGKKKYLTIDKDVKIKEENKTGNYNLQETWKLDLDDGSKIRANTHYNMNEGKTKIHVTYENKDREKVCTDACAAAKKACDDNVKACNDACEATKKSCIAACGKDSNCKKTCETNANACNSVCGTKKTVCDSADKTCNDNCRDTYNFNFKYDYTTMKTLSLYDILKLIGYA
jgi:cysteine-rich repeat protein/parallel beta-helix repeat protein